MELKSVDVHFSTNKKKKRANETANDDRHDDGTTKKARTTTTLIRQILGEHTLKILASEFDRMQIDFASISDRAVKRCALTRPKNDEEQEANTGKTAQVTD